MPTQTVLAQDVQPGHRIMIDAYASMLVARVIPFRTNDGNQGFAFWSDRGQRVWNRLDEELILK